MFITVLIGVMKVFDIVYVMTNGNFNTNVIGNEFYNQLFTNFNNGAAAAIVVMLMIAVIPIMIYQVRQFGPRRPAHDLPATTVNTTPRRRPAQAHGDRRRGQPGQGRLGDQDRPHVICFLWIVPMIGIFVTSFRTPTPPTPRAGGRSSPPSTLGT